MPDGQLPPPIVLPENTWRGRLLVPVLASVGLLLSLISSLGAPLIPTIAADYGISLSTAQWALTITLMISAISAPVIGRLADGPHRLRLLLIALSILVIGCVLAALPSSVFGLFLLGRAMQGLGLALLPLTMGVARDHLAPHRARSALALLSVTSVIGVGLGYPFTGLIAEHLSFRACYWVAAGLCFLALMAAAVVVPPSSHRRSSPFDVPGVVLMGLGLAALLLAISQGEGWGWSDARILGLFAAAVVILGGWVGFELRVEHPLVDLRQLGHRTVLTADVTAMLSGMGMYLLMSMVIRYVQTPTTVSYGLGASVVVAGLVLLPMSAASFLVSRILPTLLERLGATRVLPLGALLFAGALVTFALERDHLWELFAIMAIVGVGTGFVFAVMPRMIVGAVPAEKTSSALALNQVLRSVGFSIGSATGATILSAHTPAGQLLPTDSGYSAGAWVAVALCLSAALAAWRLPDRRMAAAAAPVVTSGAKHDREELLIEESTDAAIGGVIGFEPGEDVVSLEDDGLETSGRMK